MHFWVRFRIKWYQLFCKYWIIVIVTHFIQSKPPGNRMVQENNKGIFLFYSLLQVTSDIHKYFILFFHITHLSFYFGFLVKTIFGLLPFWLIFFLVEVLKISLHLAVAVFNFSIIIQISYILNFEWVTQFDDKVSIYIYLLFIILFI